jgi:hypothetical protein
MRATSRVARLSSHGITLAAIEKLLGRVGVLMVISCDAKMIRPDTQIDYVRGNANDARPMRTSSVLLDLLIKSTLEKISLSCETAANTKKYILAFLTTR